MKLSHRIPGLLPLVSAGTPHRSPGILILCLILSMSLQAHVLFALANPPVIKGFSPASGAFDSKVVISGAEFTGATTVVFNGVKAVFNVDSSTQITAVVPKGATSGSIVVVTPGGPAKSSAVFTVVVALPTITGFTPGSGVPAGAVTITGANFSGASAVKFNGVSANFQVNSPTQISAQVPSGATDGPITVATAGGTAQSAATFTILAPPTITGFTPTGGLPGVNVTITGTNLTGATAVNFSGVTGTFQVNSASQITAKAPPQAVNGPITVTTPAGTATSTNKFASCCIPSIHAVLPSVAVPGAFLTLYGTNVGVTDVSFQGVSCSHLIFDSVEVMHVTLPPDVTGTGPLTVTNPLGSVPTQQSITVNPPSQ